MNREDQIRIVEEICDGLRNEAMESAKKIPSHWNGFELRQWIADLAREKWVFKMERHRLKEYENDRAVLNL